MKDEPVNQGTGGEAEKRVQELTAELTRVREAQQRGEMQMAGIVNSAMDAIITVDNAQKIVLFNAAAEEMFRYPAAEVLGQPLDKLIPQRHRERHRHQVKDFGQTGAMKRSVQALGALTGLRSDGVEFPLEVSISHFAAAGENFFTAILRDITERKRADEALRASEQRYRDIFENSLEGILQTMPDGTIIAVNPALARIFGYGSADEFKRSGSNVQSHYIDATRRDELQRLLQEHGTVANFEARMRRKDGQMFWMSASVHVRRDERDGLHYEGTVEDVTERKRAEEVLQAAAGHVLNRRRKAIALDLAILVALTALAFELARRFAWFETFTDWVLGSAGKRFERLDDVIVALSFAAAGFAIFAYRRWLESRSEVAIRQQTQEALRRMHAELEARVKRRTAELHDVNSLLRTEAGERKRAEAELRLFRALVDQSSDIFEIIDPESGRFLDVNERGCAALGYTRAEYLSLRVFEIDPTVEADRWPELVRGIRAAGSVAGEGLHRRKDGTTFPVEFNAKWVRLERDYVVTVARDISARKRLEEQFLRVQRLEAIGTLASGIAHDLNNILAPMLMAAGLLKGKLTEQRDRDILSMVEHSAQRGANIIGQLLTFSRGIEGARVSVQARHLLKEMINIMRETFPRNLEIGQHVPNDLWTVVADATQLHQVLMNLCVNARDAMPNGGKLTLEAQNLVIGQAEAELHSLVKPGPYVVLSVTDTGHGIPPETLPRIFDPFFTTKGVGKGTGLGLSTVLGIAKSHGGSVTVYSEPDRGTVFKVYIPATGDSAEVASAGSFAPIPMGHGELILVVDDEAAIRDTTGRVLRQHGYRALAASNGGEAITLFVQHTGSVRVVLTDVMMPGMGGLELIRALLILDPDLKIIATSGLEREDQRSEFAGLGVTEILPKPCSPAAVLKAVDRMLAAKR